MSKPSWLETLEQVGHTVLGFIAALIFARLWIWWWEWVHQWPPGKPFAANDPSRQYKLTQVTQLDRAADTKRDLLFYDIGYTAGQVTQSFILILVGVYRIQ